MRGGESISYCLENLNDNHLKRLHGLNKVISENKLFQFVNGRVRRRQGVLFIVNDSFVSNNMRQLR